MENQKEMDEIEEASDVMAEFDNAIVRKEKEKVFIEDEENDEDEKIYVEKKLVKDENKEDN